MIQQRTMGKVSAGLISKLADEGKSVFRIADAVRILGKNAKVTADLLSEMVKRNIIVRLKAGKFLVVPLEMGNAEEYIGNWLIAAREISNSPSSYVAFASAMQYRGMLTQPFLKILVATPIRQIVPKEMRGRLTFVTIKERFIWGINSEWVTNREKVRISNLEKTIVDVLAHPRYGGGITEIAKGLWNVRGRLEEKKLKDYVERYGKIVVAKRLGYLLDVLEMADPVFRAGLKSLVRTRYDILDPTLTVTSGVARNEWRLHDNVGARRILAAVGH